MDGRTSCLNTDFPVHLSHPLSSCGCPQMSTSAPGRAGSGAGSGLRRTVAGTPTARCEPRGRADAYLPSADVSTGVCLQDQTSGTSQLGLRQTPQPRTIFQAGQTPNTHGKARRHGRKPEAAALLVRPTHRALIGLTQPVAFIQRSETWMV